MNKALEHAEHAEHTASHGSKHAALIVAVLAALLAVTEQQARHAEIAVNTNGILAADAWDQYQAKSTRQLISDNMSRMLAVSEPSADPALADRRKALIKAMEDDSVRFAKDPKDGKDAIGVRARAYERVRGEALERSHTFDNAAAAFELGIVLATASAITISGLLIRFSLLMGVVGLVLGVLGLVAPELGAF